MQTPFTTKSISPLLRCYYFLLSNLLFYVNSFLRVYLFYLLYVVLKFYLVIYLFIQTPLTTKSISSLLRCYYFLLSHLLLCKFLS